MFKHKSTYTTLNNAAKNIGQYIKENVNLLSDIDNDIDLPDNITTKNVNSHIDGSPMAKRSMMKQWLTECYESKNYTNVWSTPMVKELNNEHNFELYNSLIIAKDGRELKNMIVHFIQILGNTGNFNWINTSKVRNFRSLFQEMYEFNGHIELWDTSNVTDMSFMFYDSVIFNRDISNWNTSNVTNMSYMFSTEEFDGNMFDQPIGKWDVSNVTNMKYMFNGHGNLFNQPIGDWDVSKVTNMEGMFGGCDSFNQDISKWDVSNVTNSEGMFEDCESMQYINIPTYFQL